jgi:hypothetical protein
MGQMNHEAGRDKDHECGYVNKWQHNSYTTFKSWHCSSPREGKNPSLLFWAASFQFHSLILSITWLYFNYTFLLTPSISHFGYAGFQNSSHLSWTVSHLCSSLVIQFRLLKGLHFSEVCCEPGKPWVLFQEWTSGIPHVKLAQGTWQNWYFLE